MASEENEAVNSDSPIDGKSILSFFYQRAENFRSIHVDGAIGGPTPRGYMHIALYTERPAIPQRIDIEIERDGVLGGEVDRSGKSGILRELQCDLILDVNAAQSLAKWINENIEAIQTDATEYGNDDE